MRGIAAANKKLLLVFWIFKIFWAPNFLFLFVYFMKLKLEGMRFVGLIHIQILTGNFYLKMLSENSRTKMSTNSFPGLERMIYLSSQNRFMFNHITFSSFAVLFYLWRSGCKELKKNFLLLVLCFAFRIISLILPVSSRLVENFCMLIIPRCVVAKIFIKCFIWASNSHNLKNVGVGGFFRF